MQLISINPSRHLPKVWLKFSDDSLLPFKLDDIVLLKIKKFIDLDGETLDKIYYYSLKFLLLEYALRQIAISAKTEKIITQKLNQKLYLLLHKYPYPQNNYNFLVVETTQYLSDNKLLDQDQYLYHFINKNKYKSKRELNFLLKSQGIEFSLSRLPSDEDKIRYLVEKKLKSTDLANYNNKNKLISALVRKGFSLNEVKTVIDDLIKSR